MKKGILGIFIVGSLLGGCYGGSNEETTNNVPDERTQQQNMQDDSAGLQTIHQEEVKEGDSIRVEGNSGQGIGSGGFGVDSAQTSQ